ncbi:hypothetical protein D3C81_281810 [compost metagenome]|uniref:DUF1836 domain-containing protein n=1 Tax=Paenibacillus stellifer TaxID=169760 RepID=A0A089LRK4_9BACL|nr:DUF1836 domain-containing protein [Paenibacillus stellifer]AIQ64186.1 hypothetical protein PSTEL_14965 [Paenibacillus stellifer]
MESLTLTRVEMSALLLALRGMSAETPLHIFQEAWSRHHRRHAEEGNPLQDLRSTELPPIVLKMMKKGDAKGLSLQEIAALGALIEYSTISITAMQNWVKRDFKEYLGAPREGKKYSINQAAMLFMVEDLKSSLDFRSISRLFRKLFLKPERDDDDLLEPVRLYSAYAQLFEEHRQLTASPAGEPAPEVEAASDRLTGDAMSAAAEKAVTQLVHLNRRQRETVRNTLIIAAISVQACCFQALARQYFHASLFLDF